MKFFLSRFFSFFLSPEETRNIILAVVAGFLSGIFSLVLLFVLGFNFNILQTIGIVLVFPLLFVAVYVVACSLNPTSPHARQLTKFATVGTQNALLEFMIMNSLIFITGMAAGIYFIFFKTLSFTIAVLNAYAWNKYWTFESKAPHSRTEFFKFLFVVIIGLIINVGVASFLVNWLGAPLGVGDVAWANIAVLIAIFVAMAWNFLSQKFIIFKE